MEANFEQTLLKAGVSQEAIGILDGEELSTQADLQKGFTYEQFKAMGIKAKSARILADMFPVAQVQQPASHGVSKLYIGKEPLSELVRNAATGDVEAIEELKQRVGNKKLFIRDLVTGKMDVEASIACINFVGIGAPVDSWDKRPTESLSAILIAKRGVNPLTGSVLVPGDEWLNIPTERRILVNYAIITNAINPDAIDEDNVVVQLQQEKLSGKWERISNAYEVAKARREPTVQQAEAWLYEGGRTQQGHPFLLAAGNVPVVPQQQIVTVQQPQLPKFGPAVRSDFRKLTENYLKRDRAAMFDHLYNRGLFLCLFDLARQSDIQGVPLEALYLLRAGSEWRTFESAARHLQQIYGVDKPLIPFMGRPDDEFYQALQTYCSDEDLVNWCGEIMYHPQFAAWVPQRPRPGSWHGHESWQGHSVGLHRDY